jgi:hypothetical protein
MGHPTNAGDMSCVFVGLPAGNTGTPRFDSLRSDSLPGRARLSRQKGCAIAGREVTKAEEVFSGLEQSNDPYGQCERLDRLGQPASLAVHSLGMCHD